MKILIILLFLSQTCWGDYDCKKDNSCFPPIPYQNTPEFINDRIDKLESQIKTLQHDVAVLNDLKKEMK